MPLLPSRALTNTATEHLADHNQAHPKLNAIGDLKADFGAVGDGVADDSSALTNAMAAGIPVVAPDGTYLVGGNFTPPAGRAAVILGQGPERTIFKAKTGTTGPLFNITYAAQKHGIILQGFQVDMANAATQTAVYLNNIDISEVRNVRVRNGDYGFKCGLVQLTDFVKCHTLNTSVAGYYVGDANSSEDHFISCYHSTNGTSCVAGFDFAGGIDQWCINCASFRAPGGAFDLQYGYRFSYTVANYNATAKLLGCTADAISDRTSDSATVAALYMKGVGNCDIINSFLDGYSLSDLTSNPAVKIDDCRSLRFTQNRLGGRGVLFGSTAVSDTISFAQQEFFEGNAGATGMYVLPASNPPTKVIESGSYLGNGSLNLPLANDFSRWATATADRYGS